MNNRHNLTSGGFAWNVIIIFLKKCADYNSVSSSIIGGFVKLYINLSLVRMCPHYASRVWYNLDNNSGPWHDVSGQM